MLLEPISEMWLSRTVFGIPLSPRRVVVCCSLLPVALAACKETRVKSLGGKPVPADPVPDERAPVQPAPWPEPKGVGPPPATPKAHRAERPPRTSFKERDKLPQPRVLTKMQLTKMLSQKRDLWIQPSRVVKQLKIKPGSVVADVGCGSGYWTFRLRAAVGNSGLVYAVDFDPNALDFLRKRIAREGNHNLQVVLSRPWDTRLKPRSVDLALLVNVHFFKQPNEPEGSQVSVDFPRFYGSVLRALKPGGRMVIIEPDKDAGAGRHISAREIERQLAQVGFRRIKSYDYLKLQYFMEFVAK